MLSDAEKQLVDGVHATSTQIAAVLVTLHRMVGPTEPSQTEAMIREFNMTLAEVREGAYQPSSDNAALVGGEVE